MGILIQNIPDTITTNELVNFITDKAGVKRPMHVPTVVAWFIASIGMIVAEILRKKPFLNYEILKVATLRGGVRDIRKAQEMLDFRPKYQKILEGIDECYFHNSARK